MPNVLIRNVPQEFLDQIKAQAAMNGRSLQQELWLAVRQMALRRHPDAYERAEAFKAKQRAEGRTFSDSTELIREDRDSR
jgi:plasmid stability protein